MHCEALSVHQMAGVPLAYPVSCLHASTGVLERSLLTQKRRHTKILALTQLKQFYQAKGKLVLIYHTLIFSSHKRICSAPSPLRFCISCFHRRGHFIKSSLCHLDYSFHPSGLSSDITAFRKTSLTAHFEFNAPHPSSQIPQSCSSLGTLLKCCSRFISYRLFLWNLEQC